MDQYETVQLLGSGSYGECFLVRHKETRVLSVLKRMLVANDKARRAAHEEARLLSSLKHPNIVEYHKSFEVVQGQPARRYLCVVMQYCDGGDLLKKLLAQKGSQFPEKQIVDYLVQIMLALEYMHSKRILHRDIKTQNIFLTKNNVVKVGDFGISKVLESSIDLARTVIGTPYYMSPEILANRPYGYKSDIWATGCVLYEMMCLKHAFEGRDYMSLVNNILRGQAPPVPATYSPELRSLLHEMLQKIPSKRPSAKEVLSLPFIKRHMAEAAERLQSQAVPNRPANPLRLEAIQPQPRGPRAHAHDGARGAAPVSARGAGAAARAMPPPSEHVRAISSRRLQLISQLEETSKAKEDISQKLQRIRQQRVQEVLAPRKPVSAVAPPAASPPVGEAPAQRQAAGSGNAPAAASPSSQGAPAVSGGRQAIKTSAPLMSAPRKMSVDSPERAMQGQMAAPRKMSDFTPDRMQSSGGAQAPPAKESTPEQRHIRITGVAIGTPAPAPSSSSPAPALAPAPAAAAKQAEEQSPEEAVASESENELEKRLEEAHKRQCQLQESLEQLAHQEKDEEEDEDLHLVSSNLKLRAGEEVTVLSDGELSEGEEPSDQSEDDGSSAVTTPFPPRLPGPLSERLPLLTRYCVAGLGAELFSRAYKHVRDNEVVDAEDPSLLALLGSKSFLAETVLSVMFMEDQLKERTASTSASSEDDTS
eukprot:m51a1_g10966 putative serine threonine-protein kinase nek4 (705) ;mRNA; r:247239-250096